jgi:Amt family ammonium transporter
LQNISASVGGLTWLVLDYRLERKWSAVGLCSGAVVGLVGITPAAGYVQPSAAVAIGFLTAVCTNFATRLKFLLNVDEALDVFATHAVGGVVGNVLTALFAQASVAALDGTTAIPGGWIDRHWVQLGYQLADSVAAMAYSLGMTTVLCWLFHFVPFMRLRASTDESEIIGLDESELGEFAYDFVALDPEARLVHHESPAVSSTATRLGEAERKASV